MEARREHRSENPNRGDLGAEDRLGAMNLGGQRSGPEPLDRSQDRPTDQPVPSVQSSGRQSAVPPLASPRRFATLRAGKNAGGQCFGFAKWRDNSLFTGVVSEDVPLLHAPYSTRWDGLAHVGCPFDSKAAEKAGIIFYRAYSPQHGLSVMER